LKVVVCIKQVPEVSEIKFNSETKTIVREGVPCAVNPFDRRAVTEAVKIKEKFGGAVTIITMGPSQAREAIIECLAMGADKGMHLVDKVFAGADTLATARALAAALKREEFDIIFCGRCSTDSETGQVGPEVAELLEIPHVTGVRNIKFRDNKVVVERETDEGYEVIECEIPVLFTAAERLNRPIKVSSSDIEAAVLKPIEIITAQNLLEDISNFGLKGSPTYVSDIFSIKTKREVIVASSANPSETAEKLTQYLIKRGLFERIEETHISERRIRNKEKPRNGRSIWVVSELTEGRLRNVTLELLGEGVRLSEKIGGELYAVLIGTDLTHHSKTLTAYGADKIYLIEHNALHVYTAEGYANALIEAIKTYKPYIVLFPSTSDGRDYAPRVSARLKLGLTGDCIGFDINERGELIQLKPAFGGNIVASILSRTVPRMATVRPGMLKKICPDWTQEAVVERITPVNPGPIRTKVLSVHRDADASTVEIDSADTVITVGMGIGGTESLSIIKDLANVLGASIGATRKVVDAGWLPPQHQVGLTGKTIAPRLCIAVGVRGAFNHSIGIQKSGIVVAINRDPKAEIFQNADYGIVGDFARVIPAIVESLRRAKGQHKKNVQV
jgi:electron transfer flavoprotein alpha subunit